MNVSSFSLAKLIAAFTILFAFIVVIIGSISVSMNNEDRVAMGVQSDGVTLAGMSRQEVHRYFEKTAQQKLKQTAIVLTFKDRSWNIRPEDIALHANVDQAADEAYRTGRENGFFLNLITQMRCALTGRSIRLTGAYDEDLLNSRLIQIQKDIERQPVNASARLLPDGRIKKTPAVIGLNLDIQPVADTLRSQLEGLARTVSVHLEPEEQLPFVRDEDLADIDTVLGAYTTRFQPGDRGDNIGIAASHLQGVLIRSQAELSFNRIVGRRTRSAGYKDAGVIVDGEPAVDVGGGVCQVSSTLYNAILLAGMTPTERSSHSLPSHYVPAGRDATVADDLLDFSFRNPLPHPVYLRIANTGSALTIYVLGTRSDLNGRSISLLTDGPAGRPSLYRLWKQNGQIVEREYLHTDNYS